MFSALSVFPHPRKLRGRAGGRGWRSAGIMLLLIALCAGPLFGQSLPQASESDRFVPREGVLDLRDWDPDQTPIVSLAGDWQFVPFAFVPPGHDWERLRANRDVYLADLPGSWLDTPLEANMPVRGYATYRLVVLLPALPLSQNLGLWTGTIASASRVYWDGELVHSSGNPAATLED